MTNFQFLQKYQKLQYSIMYDELIDLSFAVIGYSKIDPSPFWNNALTKLNLSDEQISEIENKLHLVDRKSTLYFEHCSDLEKLANSLQSKGYVKNFEDCWQFWNGLQIDEKHFESVRKVTTEQELEVFLQTFDNCYKKDDPQNPYGELGDYLKVAKEAWHKHNQSNRLEYFVVFKGDKPISVSTLTNYEGIGYISNVGSLREVRGQGYGKAATLYCVSQSIKNKNEEHCLATEEGHYPNTFYQQIGFSTRFSAVGYTK